MTKTVKVIFLYCNYEKNRQMESNNQKVFRMKNTIGLYRNDSIIIQNSGNEINQYNNFKNCTAKYLIFVKAKK